MLYEVITLMWGNAPTSFMKVLIPACAIVSHSPAILAAVSGSNVTSMAKPLLTLTSAGAGQTPSTGRSLVTLSAR